MNQTILNRTAAEIAAAAFHETFPGVVLLGGEASSIDFSFHVRCSTLLPPESEVLLEEKMRQIVREKRSIRVLEMVPVSARGLLLKEGHAARADELPEDGLVEIVQIGRYHNLSPGPHLSCTSELSAFKLWPPQDIGDGILRLSGCAFGTKDKLKQFLKRFRAYPKRSHEQIGLKQFLWRFQNGRLVWLPDGLKRIEEMVGHLREHLFKGLLEVRMDLELNRAAFAKEMGVEGIAEIYFEPNSLWDPKTGLFAGDGGVWARVNFYPAAGHLKGQVISSLQLAEKTLNILGFQHCLRLNGSKRSGKGFQVLLQSLEALGREVEIDPGETTSQLEFLVEDQLGRQWPAFSMEVAASGVFITASVERLVALLIEKKSRINETVDEIENQ